MNMYLPAFPEMAGEIDQLVNGPFFVLGTSMGGTNALYVASLLPDRVRGVILEGSMTPLLPEEDLRHVPSDEPAPEDGEYPLPDPHPRKPWATAPFMAQQMANRFRMFKWVEPDLQGTSAIKTVAELRVPVLALLGDNDGILFPSQAQRFREQLPDAQFHLVPEGGHDLQNTAPEKFLTLVEGFITAAR